MLIKPKEWPLLWLRTSTWLLGDVGLHIVVQSTVQWWTTLLDGQILPWRCAVVVALRPCVATLAGSHVWGDLPLSVRLYVHSYKTKRHVASGGCCVWRSSRGSAGCCDQLMPQILQRRYEPQLAGGLCLIFAVESWSQTSPYCLEAGGIAIRSPRSFFMEAHRAHLWPRAMRTPSAEEMLCMAAACYGDSAPSTRYS